MHEVATSKRDLAVTLARRLSLLRGATVLGLAMLLLGFLGFLAPPGLHGAVMVLLAVGFPLAIVASSLLAFVRCPACGKPFIGTRLGGDVHPSPRPFTRQCRHCGHAP